MRILTAFLVGALFAVGLGISGMTQPDKVIGFLDFLGSWDPSLLFVMMGAASFYVVFFWIVRGEAPLLAKEFRLPTRRDIDARLAIGAALFGAGWGLAGFCPGPALTSLASGSLAVVVFVGAMVVGMVGHAAVTPGPRS